MIVRDAVRGDVPALCVLLNEIIEIGGTTAYEDPLSEARFEAKFLGGAGSVSCVVAEQDGVLLGFQWLRLMEPVGDKIASIASFAKARSDVKGVGRALFARSKTHAAAQGIAQIDAKIRGDNVSGLGYYSAMGFEDFDVVKAVPLSDGTPVDRVVKRYVVS